MVLLVIFLFESKSPPEKNNFKSKWYCSLYFSLLQLSGWCQPMWWMSFQHFWKYTAYITRNLWQMSVIFRRPTECHLAKKNRYIFWPSKKYTWKAKFFLFKTSLTLDTYGITKIACLTFDNLMNFWIWILPISPEAK